MTTTKAPLTTAPPPTVPLVSGADSNESIESGCVRAKRHTPEDLLTMAEGKYFELIDGQLVETASMSLESSYVAANLIAEILIYNKTHRLGGVFEATASYQCFPHAPSRVRRPDVSFIHKDRLAPEMMQGHVRVAPDLAAEVVSPSDTAENVQTRIEDYLHAGVRLMWVLYPLAQAAMAYRPDHAPQHLHADAQLDGGDVLPGFDCPLGHLFAPPVDSPSPQPGGQANG